jgi:hypothetical protein
MAGIVQTARTAASAAPANNGVPFIRKCLLLRFGIGAIISDVWSSMPRRAAERKTGGLWDETLGAVSGDVGL